MAQALNSSSFEFLFDGNHKSRGETKNDLNEDSGKKEGEIPGGVGGEIE